MADDVRSILDRMKSAAGATDEPKTPATGDRGAAFRRAADKLGVDPVDLASIVSFESAGSFDPHKVGGEGNRYRGLIQFGPDEQKQYYKPGQSFEDQLEDGVVRFFQDRFKKVGMDTRGAKLEDLYTTVIAGNPKANRNAKDSFGTSARSGSERIAREHRPKVLKDIFGGQVPNSQQEQPDGAAGIRELVARLGGGQPQQPASPTFAAPNFAGQQPPMTTAQATPPVPEKPQTLDAQRKAMHDPRSSRASVLYTPGEQVPPPQVGETDIPLPDGSTLRSNTQKFEAALKQNGITSFDLMHGRADFTPLLGGKAEPTNDTAGKPAVVTRDAQTGTELVASAVTDPNNLEKEAALQKAQFPSQPTATTVEPGDAVAQARMAGNEVPQLPGTETDVRILDEDDSFYGDEKMTNMPFIAQVDPDYGVEEGQDRGEAVFRQAIKQAGPEIMGRPLSELEINAITEFQRGKKGGFVFDRDSNEKRDPFKGAFVIEGEDMAAWRDYLGGLQQNFETVQRDALRDYLAGGGELDEKAFAEFEKIGLSREKAFEVMGLNPNDFTVQRNEFQDEVDKSRETYEMYLDVLSKHPDKAVSDNAATHARTAMKWITPDQAKKEIDEMARLRSEKEAEMLDKVRGEEFTRDHSRKFDPKIFTGKGADWQGRAQKEADTLLRQLISKHGSATNYYAVKKSEEKAEEARQRRVAAMSWPEYYVSTMRDAPLNLTKSAVSIALSSTLRGIAVGADMLQDALPEWMDLSESDQKLRGGKAEDRLTYKLADGIDTFMDTYLPTDKDLQQEFLAGKLPSGIGSTFGMMGGGFIGAAFKAPRVGVAVFSSLAMGGDAYKEARQAGASEAEAQIAGLLNAPLGLTEVVGIGSALKRLNSGVDVSTWQRLWGEAWRAGAKEIPEEFAQEGTQTIASNLIAKMTYDPERKFDKDLYENLIVAGVSAPLASGGVTILNFVRNRHALKKQIEQEQARGAIVRRYDDGELYVFDTPVDITDEIKPLVQTYDQTRAGIEAIQDQIKGIQAAARKEKQFSPEQKELLRQMWNLQGIVKQLEGIQVETSKEIAAKAGVKVPEGPILEQPEQPGQADADVQSALGKMAAAAGEQPTTQAETQTEPEPAQPAGPTVYVDKKGQKFEEVEDRGEQVVVKNEKGGTVIRNKKGLTEVNEEPAIQEPAAPVAPEALATDIPAQGETSDVPVKQPEVSKKPQNVDTSKPNVDTIDAKPKAQPTGPITAKGLELEPKGNEQSAGGSEVAIPGGVPVSDDAYNEPSFAAFRKANPFPLTKDGKDKADKVISDPLQVKATEMAVQQIVDTSTSVDDAWERIRARGLIATGPNARVWRKWIARQIEAREKAEPKQIDALPEKRRGFSFQKPTDKATPARQEVSALTEPVRVGGLSSVLIKPDDFNTLPTAKQQRVQELIAEAKKLNVQVPGIDLGPDQVRRMSNRQKEATNKGIIRRNEIVDEIRQLLKSDKQVADESRAADVKKAKERLNQIDSHDKTIKGLGRMAYKPNGELRAKYQRTVDRNAQERDQIFKDHPDLAPKAAGNALRPEAQPIRQLGTGANVYFEQGKYRVNDDRKGGGVLLNIPTDRRGEFPRDSIKFDNPSEAVQVAEQLHTLYPEGVSDTVDLDAVVRRLRSEKNTTEKPATRVKSPTEAKNEERQELREPRRAAGETRQGKETAIRIPDSKAAYEARYELREIGDVIPSHNPFNFQPNPDYYFANDRRYDAEQQYQAQVIDRSKDDNFNPAELLNNSPTADTGPTIIDEDSNALGGNSRAMILARVYKANGEAANAYRTELANQASIYGFTAADVNAFKNPVLVRVISDASIDKQTAITNLNKTSTTPLTAKERAVAEAGRLSDDAVEYIAGYLEAAGDGTLNDALNQYGDKIVNKLIADGVFTAGERNTLLENGAITTDGKSRIERLLMGRIYDDVQQYEYAPPYLQRNLPRAVAPLVKTQTDADWDILPQTREAIDLLTEFRAKAGKGTTLEDYAKIPTLTNQAWSPDAIAIAQVLSQSPNAVSKAFKIYAREFTDAKSGAALFGALSPNEAFAAAFSDGGVDFSYTSIKDIEAAGNESSSNAAMRAERGRYARELDRLLGQNAFEWGEAATVVHHADSNNVGINPAGMMIVNSVYRNLGLVGEQMTIAGAYNRPKVVPQIIAKIRDLGDAAERLNFTELSERFKEIATVLDKAVDPTYGDLLLSVEDPRYPAITKFTLQEEQGHRADSRLIRDLGEDYDLAPYRDSPAYRKAISNLEKRGYVGPQRHIEVIGKIQRNDAQEALGLTRREISELQRIRTKEIARSGLSFDDLSERYGNISESNKGIVERYAARIHRLRDREYEREELRRQQPLSDSGGKVSGQDGRSGGRGARSDRGTGNRSDGEELRRRSVLAPNRSEDGTIADAASFSLNPTQQELDAIPEVRNDEGQLIAPNGKPSNLPNERIWKMVRTPAFKEWFGDWESVSRKTVKPVGISDEVSASSSSLRPTTGSTPSNLLQPVLNVNENDVSKVVDENGDPLVVYRGDRFDDFDTFDRSKTNEKGFFFTPDQEIASVYAQGKEPRSFYLKADNLLDLTQDTLENRKWITKWAESFDDWTDRQTGEEMDAADVLFGGGMFDFEGDWSQERWRDLQATAEYEGYDGVILPDWDNGKGVFPSYVVFAPNQIKSAIGNSGAFDPNESSILKRARTPDLESAIDEIEGADLAELTTAADPRDLKRDRYRLETASVEVYEIIRRAAEQNEINKGSEGEVKFDAIYLSPDQVTSIVGILKDGAREAVDAGLSTAEANKLADIASIIEEAAKEGDGSAIVYLFDDALPHEEWHKAGYQQAVDKKLAGRHSAESIAALVGSAAVQKLRKGAFSRLYPSASDAVVVEEAAAWLAGGGREQLNAQNGEMGVAEISEDEAVDFLTNWVLSFKETNPDADLQEFAKINDYANRIIEHTTTLLARDANKGPGRTTEGDQRTGDQGRNEASRPANDEGGGSPPGATEAGRVADAKFSLHYEKVRDQFADAMGQEYDPITIAEQARKAFDFIQENRPRAMRVVYDIEAPPKGLSKAAVGIVLSQSLRAAGKTEQAQTVARLTSLMFTQAAQDLNTAKLDFGDPRRLERSIESERLKKLGKTIKLADQSDLEKGRTHVRRRATEESRRIMMETRKVQTADQLLAMLLC